jgi:regulator of sigma E protease
VSQASQSGLKSVLNITGLLSINLGLINLLPFPALDGGRIIFIALEILRGKPIDQEKEGFVHFVGFVILMTLMVLLVMKDLNIGG